MVTLSHMTVLDDVLTAPSEDGSDPINDRVLEAARQEFEMVGIRRASVIDIARRARVSRATLYRRFQDKDSLVAAVLAQDVAATLGRIDAATAAEDDATEALVTIGVIALRELRQHPILSRLLETEPEELYHWAVGNGEAILALARGFVAPRLRALRPVSTLPAGDVEVGAEMLVRLWTSITITPGGVIPAEDDEAVARFLRRYIVPLFTDGGREPAIPGPVEVLGRGKAVS